MGCARSAVGRIAAGSALGSRLSPLSALNGPGGSSPLGRPLAPVEGALAPETGYVGVSQGRCVRQRRQAAAVVVWGNSNVSGGRPLGRRVGTSRRSLSGRAPGVEQSEAHERDEVANLLLAELQRSCQQGVDETEYRLDRPLPA